MSRPFIPFGPEHLAALFATLVLSLVMVWLGRSGHPAARPMQRVLAVLLLLQWPLSFAALALSGDLSLQNGLPLHFCDVAATAAAVTLLWRHALAAEFAYFYGLAGTLQGLITPNLAYAFPHPRFFSFFLSHSGVVIAAFVIVFGMGLQPRAWAALRMLGWMVAYALLVGGINALLGTNYGFLCAKPTAASALDALGPWPWYIGGIAIVAGIAYSLLDAPFAWQRRRARLSTQQ